MIWRWELGLLGNIQQPCTAVQPKRSSQFLHSPTERLHQPRPDPPEFCQDNRLPDRRVLGKFLRSQHQPLLIMPPRLNVTTHSDPVKRWNFRKADWNRFFLLTGESVQRLPPPDTTNVEKAYQELCESLLSATKQCTHVIVSRTIWNAGQRVRDRLSRLPPNPSVYWLW